MAFVHKLLIETLGIASKTTRQEMAINVGKRLADVKATMGGLDKAAIESVFTDCLPKKFRSTLLTTREEMIPYWEKSGYTHEQAVQASRRTRPGMTVPNGSHKQPLYVPTTNTDCSAVAHELQHTFDRNNTLKGKAQRHLLPIFVRLVQLIHGKKFMEELIQTGQESVRIQDLICSTFGLHEHPNLQNIVKSLYRKEDLLKHLNLTEQEYEKQLRNVLRQFVNPYVKGSQNVRRYRSFKFTANIECPAYSVGGEVQRKAGVLDGDIHYSQKAVSFVYEDMKSIIRQEKRLYRKNWLLGKLNKRPQMYQTEKDLYKLVSSKEDKTLIKELSRNMSSNEKKSLFMLLQIDSKNLSAVKAFLEKTSVNGKSPYSKISRSLAGLNPKAIENEDFIKLALLNHDGYPIFSDSISIISHAEPEKIKKLLELAQKYPEVHFQPLASYCINNPNFDLLSKLATVKIGNEYVYEGLMYELNKLNSEQLTELYKKAEKVKDGREACDLVQSILKEREVMTLKKCELHSALNNIIADTVIKPIIK